MSKEWDEMLADVKKHACKVCGVYRCQNHVQDEWVVCPKCPDVKYWLKYHTKCPYCGASATVEKETKHKPTT